MSPIEALNSTHETWPDQGGADHHPEAAANGVHRPKINLFDGYQTVMAAAARALEPDPVQADDLAQIVFLDSAQG